MSSINQDHNHVSGAAPSDEPHQHSSSPTVDQGHNISGGSIGDEKNIIREKDHEAHMEEPHYPEKVKNQKDLGIEEEEKKMSVMDQLRGIRAELYHPRYRVIFCIIFITKGMNWMYTIPGLIGTGPENTIQNDFALHHGDLYDQERNQLMFSIVSYPNVILATVAGVFVDKIFGLRFTAFYAQVLITLGSIIFYIGVRVRKYYLLCLGMFSLSLGFETTSVCELSYIYRWFACSPCLALAITVEISVSRLFEAAAALIIPRVARKWGVSAAVFTSIIACSVSLLSVIIMWTVDVWGSKKGHIPAQIVGTHQHKIPTLKDLATQPVTLWLLCFFTMFSFGCLAPLVGIMRNFFEVKYELTGVEATSYMSIRHMIGIPFGIAASAAVDRVGRYAYWLIFACVVVIVVELALIFTMIPPYVVTISLGAFFCFALAALWPLIPSVAEENAVGFAYGLVFSIQSIGLATFPIICGAILDKYTPPRAPDAKRSPLPALKGFNLCCIMFITNAVIAIVIVIVMIIIDSKGKRVTISNAHDLREQRRARRADLYVNQKNVNADE